MNGMGYEKDGNGVVKRGCLFENGEVKRVVQEFDEKDDYDLVDSDASIAGDLADDKFALFVAGEPHMPTLEFQGDGAQPVKKICFKLLADAYWEE